MVFNPFRRKQKPADKKEPEAEGAAVSPLAGDAAPQKNAGAAASKQNLPSLVRKVLRTEKATALGMFNQYVFRVEPRANKRELAGNVEKHYGVHVAKMRILNAPGKKRRVKGVSGWKTGYKKAIVTIREGEKIEVGV